MDSQTRNTLIYFVIMCVPIVLVLIVGFLSSSFKTVAGKNGWVVQAHPDDHRDYLFTGQIDGISWKMEYYIYEHYRKRALPVLHIPYTKVIVWTTDSMSLFDNTLLVYPRKDKIKHFVHPRLVVTGQTQADDGILVLQERAIDNVRFDNQFVLRTDFETIPQNLVNTLQTELMFWSNIQLIGPIILINKDGTVIWWIPIGMKREYLEKTTKLGLSLARSF